MAKKKAAPPAPAPVGEVMDLKEAAEFLKVSKPTFYRWLARGQDQGCEGGPAVAVPASGPGELPAGRSAAALPSEGARVPRPSRRTARARKLEPLPLAEE